jgi:hypothetical protein
VGLILRLLFSALIGFVSHVFWKPTRVFEERHGARWANKLRHAIGVLTMAVPQAMITNELKMPHGKTRSIVATLLAGLSYGGGNFLAHILSTWIKEGK